MRKAIAGGLAAAEAALKGDLRELTSHLESLLTKVKNRIRIETEVTWSRLVPLPSALVKFLRE